MCWKCDHPESTVEEWLDAIRETKDKHGWAVQFVESARTPFAYTIGLHERGLPELLVTGASPQQAVRMLNGVADYLVRGGRPLPGELICLCKGSDDRDGLMLEVVQVQHPEAHLNVAVAFYGPDLHALQLVWRDDRGHCPWCPEFDNGQARQPVLGVRAAGDDA